MQRMHDVKKPLVNEGPLDGYKTRNVGLRHQPMKMYVKECKEIRAHVLNGVNLSEKKPCQVIIGSLRGYNPG